MSHQVDEQKTGFMQSPNKHIIRAVFSGKLSRNMIVSLFLRKLVLGILAQASGKNLTRQVIVPTASGVLLLSPNTQQGVLVSFSQ